jgi:hypothetical protein
MDILTILNVADDEGRIVYIYFLCLIGIPFVALFVVFKYNETYKKWVKELIDPNKAYGDIEIAQHSVMIHNLPQNIGAKKLTKRVS